MPVYAVHKDDPPAVVTDEPQAGSTATVPPAEVTGETPPVFLADAGIVASGTCGTNAAWELDSNGVLTISGSGIIPDYTEYETKFYGSYGSQIKKIVIGDGITRIGNYAFRYLSSLEEVALGNSVKSIGKYAFTNCSALSGELNLPKTLTSIENYAFSDCKSLTGKLVIPDGVTEISNYAFLRCAKLTEVELGSGVTKIGAYAFRNCTGLTGKLTIPDSVTTIGNYAFAGCTGLTELELGENLSSIGENAFYESTSLSGILEIPDKVTSIGRYAFYNLDNLTGLKLGQGLQSIGSYAFYTCDNLTGQLVLPDALTTIDTYAFAYCPNITGITFGSGIQNIQPYAFYNCYALTGALEIPDTVTTLGDHAFGGCKGLTSVKMGTGVRTLNASIFISCSSIQEITLTCPTPDKVTTDTFGGMSALKQINLPAEAYSAYVGTLGTTLQGVRFCCPDAQTDMLIEDGVLIAYLGDEAELEIPDEVTKIANGAFRNSPVVSVTLPESVVEIESYAFINADALTQVTGPGVKTIGDYAFYDCDALQQVRFQAAETVDGYAFYMCQVLQNVQIPSVKTIGLKAFYECNALTDMNYGNGVTSIGGYAFYNCHKMKGSLVLPQTLTSLGSYAFYGCGSLTGSVIIPSGLKSIPEYVFHSCSGLNGELHIADTVTSIGQYAFYNCNKLTGNLRIPDSVKTIGASCFYECRGFDGMLFLSANLTSLPGSAFYNCTKLSGTLQLPAGLTSLGASTFRGCKGFTGTLTLPETLTAIPNYAFDGCSGITGTLVIPNGVKKLENSAFSGMSSLERVELGTGLTTIATSSGTLNYAPFYKCNAVKEMVFHSETAPKIYCIALDYMTALERIYVPEASYAAYKTELTAQVASSRIPRIIPLDFEEEFYIVNGELLAYTGEGGVVTVPQGVTKISSYAFSCCEDITEVILPEGVQSIGYKAFYGCTNLTRINLPDSLTAIGQYIFYGCTSLTQINLPDGITSIGQYAFYGCTALAMDLVIPDSVTSLGKYAFYQCKALTSLDLGEGLVTIGDCAFYECSGLTGDLVIPNSVETLGKQAFVRCTGLKGTLTLSEKLTSIPNAAFYDCEFTGALVIPDSVTTIGEQAFYSNGGLTSITLGAGITHIGGDTYSDSRTPFNECYGVTEFTFKSEAVPALRCNPFYGLTNLTTVYVPQTSYGLYATALKSYLPTKATLLPLDDYSEFVVEDGVLVGYLGEGGDVVIPDTVTSIANSVFRDNTTITSVTIPDTVTSIGGSAFYGCTALKSVTLPSNLVEIGAYAFYNCEAMTGHLVIPNTVTTMGDYAFYQCKGLTGLTLSESLTKIPAYAFYYCNQLTGELVIPDSVTDIGSYAFFQAEKITSIVFGSGLEKITGTGIFAYCRGVKSITFRGAKAPTGGSTTVSDLNYLTTVNVPSGSYGSYAAALSYNLSANARFRCPDTQELFLIQDNVLVAYLGDEAEVAVPDGVTKIGTGAFLNNRTLTKITLPQGITAIGDYAFHRCTKLSGFDFQDTLESIGKYAFYDCTAMAGDLILPDGIQTIGDYAFYYCTKLGSSLKLPAQLKIMGDYAFYYCSGLKGELVIPDQVISIYKYAFSSSGFDSVVIGTGVQTVWSYAFQNCTSLKTITFLGAPPTNADFVFLNVRNVTTVYVPSAYFSSYLSMLAGRLPVGCRLLALDNDEEFIIENGVLVSYQGTGGDVVVPDGVTSIGEKAFNGCTDVTSVTLPGTVTTIGSYAFRGCTGLTSIDLSDGLNTIGSYAFSGCTGLTSINLPGSLSSIDSYAFDGCTALTGKLVIPGNVETINAYAFQNCKALTGLELNDGLKAIGNYAFYDCSGMKGDLIIPDTVTSIGSHAFNKCSSFDGKLVLSESLTYIYEYTFYGCSGIKGQLVIPDKVHTVYNGAFKGMTGLDSIVIGASVETMGTGSSDSTMPFANCSGATEVAFTGETPPTFGANPFYSMSKLETVYVPAESYDAYVAVLSKYLDASKISTDFLTARITNLTAESAFSRSIVLTWNPHTSDKVVGYTITCNGEIVGTSAECLYAVRGLEENTSYTFTVQGYTEDGRTTGVGELKASTVMPDVIDLRTVSNTNKINEASNTIYIYVTDRGNLGDAGSVVQLSYAGHDGAVVIGQAQIDDDLSTSAVAVYTLNWDLDGIEDGEYQLTAALTDPDGATGSLTETVTVDRRVPAQILGITAFGNVDVIHLNWAVAAELDTHIYRVYRKSDLDDSYRLIAQINDRATLTYADRNIRKDRTYYYYVVGVNELNQEGVPSLVVGATLAPDQEAPVVTKMAPANGCTLLGQVTLSVTATDNVQVSRITLEYSTDDGQTWNALAELAGGSDQTVVDTTQIPDGNICIRAVAWDAAGNASNPLVYQYRVDNCGPEKVKGITWTSTTTSVTLRWENVSDEDIHFFRVEKRISEDTYVLVRDVYGVLGINIYDLTPNTGYTYRVVGYDLQGNRGTHSDDVTVETLKDTTAPVITLIRPLPGYFRDSIPVIITATDECAIRSIAVQVSTDLENWETVSTRVYGGEATSQTMSYELDLTGCEEGAFYIRGIATDTSGNVSDSSVNAPYVQHILDRTAPAVPQQVAAIGQCGYIEISWTQGSENDLNGYSLYRAETEEGEYVLLKSGLTTINYFDRDVQEDMTYFYRLAADDQAGNQSQWSEAVFAQVGEDTEPPVILAVYPQKDSVMGAGNNGLRISAKDNHVLQSLLVEYSRDGLDYQVMYELEDISQYGQNAEAKVPVTEFQHGDTVYLRVSAKDRTGNVSDPYLISYVIDAEAPVVSSAEASYDAEEEQVTIRWNGNEESDLYGYRLYRTIDGETSLLGFIPAVSGQTAYACTDSNLPVTRETCTYKVEAVDKCGNASGLLTNSVELPDRQFPRAVISCDNTMEKGVEYVISAASSTDNSAIVSYFFDFGDGTTSTEIDNVHVYPETGEYQVTLTVVDDDGHKTVVKKTITVVDRAAIGTVTINVVDENGKALADVPVYFDLGEESQTMKRTDSTGRVIFTSVAGIHSVGAVIANNEWLPAKKDVVVLAGADTSATLILVHQPLVEGEFEVNRMTFEEIEAAGIDTSKPENQHVVNVNVSLNYGSAEIQTSFIYNMMTQQLMGDPVYSSKNSTTPDRELIPVFIDETTIALLDVPIGASFLKEFFEVRLYIVNNAATEFALTDNLISLNVPEGLTIVAADNTQSGPVVEIDSIAGQSSATITWILRGDQEGDYHLTADYSGILSQFDEPIHTQFVTREPIHVYGLSAAKLIAEVNSSINSDAFYFNLTLENTSGIDINLPSIEITDNILTSYMTRVLAAAGEEVNPDREDMEMSQPVVKHLNSVLTNASGHSQHFGTENQILTLASGESLTKKYAAYNVTGYNNLMYLKDAVFEIAQGCGIRFELIQTDMDLFSTDDAAQKLENIAGSAAKMAQLSEILDCSRYFYVLEALNRSDNVFVREDSALYAAMTEQLCIDKDYSAEDTAQITRAAVAQLMADDAIQQAVAADVDGMYLQMVQALLTQAGQWLSAEADDAVLSSYAAAENNVRTLAEKLKTFGLEGFWSALTAALAKDGLSDAGRESLAAAWDNGSVRGAVSDAIGGLSSMLAGITNQLDDVSEDWMLSSQLVGGLLYACAAQEQAAQLLDMLIDYTGSCNGVHNALKQIRSEMTALDQRLASRFQELLKASEADQASLYNCLDTVYGISGGASNTLVKLTFGSIGNVTSYMQAMEDRHVLRVCAQISLALRQAVERYGLNAENDDQAVYTMTALKYLIKMRLIGENCFVLSANMISPDDTLAWVNETLDASYESLDDYLDSMQASLLSCRDTLFSSYYTDITVPEAPAVTLNYLNNCTRETFSSAYEYSFDGENWTTCSGKPISFTPGTVNKYLWVRMKETTSSFAGNAAKIVIPGAERISGDFYMIYVEDGYQISGLPAGTYNYAFTNERGEVAMDKRFTVEEGEIIKIQAEDGWTFLAIQHPATEDSFASQIRYLVAEKPWVLNTDTYLVTDMQEETTSMQVINYYGAKGYAVTVIGADGTATQAVGTGCVVTLDGKDYSAVVTGDLNGDAVIDITDLYLILDYMNGDEQVEGVYHKAGCIIGEEDMSLSDLLAEVDYITGGNFS